MHMPSNEVAYTLKGFTLFGCTLAPVTKLKYTLDLRIIYRKLICTSRFDFCQIKLVRKDKHQKTVPGSYRDDARLIHRLAELVGSTGTQM